MGCVVAVRAMRLNLNVVHVDGGVLLLFNFQWLILRLASGIGSLIRVLARHRVLLEA